MSYERVYRKALVSNRWTFTRAYKALAPLSDDVPTASSRFPWAYRFPLPGDCINLIGVMFPPSSSGDPISNAYGVMANKQYGRLDCYGTDYVEALKNSCCFWEG
jgi:hypothetical protein